MKCGDITAGMLRNKVTVERLTDTPDGMGGYTKSWSSVQTAWMHLKPLSGSERLHAQYLEAATTHRAHCRASVDVTTADRLKKGSRVFNVRAVLDLEERGKFYELQLEEGVAT